VQAHHARYSGLDSIRRPTTRGLWIFDPFLKGDRTDDRKMVLAQVRVIDSDGVEDLRCRHLVIGHRAFWAAGELIAAFRINRWGPLVADVIVSRDHDETTKHLSWEQCS
jgi:hypothetical protein